jgi:hypothetical protein
VTALVNLVPEGSAPDSFGGVTAGTCLASFPAPISAAAPRLQGRRVSPTRALSAIWDRSTLEVHGGRVATCVGEPVPHIRPLPGIWIFDRFTVDGTVDLHYLAGAH